jgi:hypothetical protein
MCQYIAKLRYLPLISTYIAVTLTTKNNPLGSTMSFWQEYRARAIQVQKYESWMGQSSGIIIQSRQEVREGGICRGAWWYR